MTPINITIDGATVTIPEGSSILSAARALGVDIPTLCYLEKCGPLNTCQVCLVKVNGKLVPSCGTKVVPGMVVESETEEVHEARRTALELLFSDHVGDCLSPCHRLCPLGLNIPVLLRQIQESKLKAATATVRGALPLAGVLGRLCHHPCEQGCRRGNWDSPAAIRDMERFVTDWQRGGNPKAEGRGPKEDRESNPGATQGGAASHSHSQSPERAAAETSGVLPPRAANSNKKVLILGSGPAGLSAAYFLARQGHGVTVMDRHEQAGGSLRSIPEASLPAEVLNSEIAWLELLGVRFQLGAEVPDMAALERVAGAHDAVLLAIGESGPDATERLGLPRSGVGLTVDPNTCRTPLAKVFATGAAVRPGQQLVRVMSEGRAAAECIHRLLTGKQVRRPEKVFSSVMGRLAPAEMRQFLAGASAAAKVSPCDRCAGHTPVEAAAESSRCLHCDCRSSGNCVLQHYAQVYGADANRFRSTRRPFEQSFQPGGVIFEPGKCILCGICVKLTEMAAEPLGLTFIGRGFDVRIGAPLNHTIQEGLQKVAEECVKQCPTGALAFSAKV